MFSPAKVSIEAASARNRTNCEPFLEPRRKPWLPSEMMLAPELGTERCSGLSVEPHNALLINPFYPKDPNASFGKHVLTPTLALTSFAATSPDHWRVE